MGSLYVASNVDLDIEVAVKLVRTSRSYNDDDERLLASRLLQEARAAARIGHQAIARVFDVGTTADGRPYVVMELLEGETLAQILGRERSLSPQRAVQILLPIADALSATHSKGIVHRDIKPDNVFLASTGAGRSQPKLIDFGVAKVERRNRERMTAVGSVVGSPAYVSPEQAMGQDVDASADIWSFCVLLYELVRGEPPFAADELGALLRAIIDSPHTSLAALGLADDGLAGIVDRGLAKSRDERYGSMRELGCALASWLAAEGVHEDVVGNSIQTNWLDCAGVPVVSPGRAPSAELTKGTPAPLGLQDTRPGELDGALLTGETAAPSEGTPSRRLSTTDFVGVPMIPSDVPPRPDGTPQRPSSGSVRVRAVWPSPSELTASGTRRRSDDAPEPPPRRDDTPDRPSDRAAPAHSGATPHPDGAGRPASPTPVGGARPSSVSTREPPRSGRQLARGDQRSLDGPAAACAAAESVRRVRSRARVVPLAHALVVGSVAAALAVGAGWIAGSCHASRSAPPATTAPK